MPLGLDEKCRARLIELVEPALAEIDAIAGMFVERRSTRRLIRADLVLPQNGKLRERLVRYIDELPFSDFVIETIGRELYELNRYVADKTLKLPEIQEYADTKSVAERLVAQFETLPWQYTLTVPLPHTLNDLLPKDADRLQLSPICAIARADDVFKQAYPLATDNPQRTRRMNNSTILGLFGKDTPNWNDTNLYFQIQTEGFVGQYGGTTTTHDALRLLRSFSGLGLAGRLLDWEQRYSPAKLNSPVYVHRKAAEGSWQPETRFDADDSISRGLSGLKLHDVDGHLKTPAQKAAWTAARLNEISVALSAGEKAEATLLAARPFKLVENVNDAARTRLNEVNVVSGIDVTVV